jgi:glycosyltransferase involved in cell wall biosynthesis
MVIREALASGVPILASDIGPLGELVPPDCGQLFQAGDSNDLLAHARTLMTSEEVRLAEMATAAREEFNLKYTADINFAKLTSIYREAIDSHSLKQ